MKNLPIVDDIQHAIESAEIRYLKNLKPCYLPDISLTFTEEGGWVYTFDYEWKDSRRLINDIASRYKVNNDN